MTLSKSTKFLTATALLVTVYSVDLDAKGWRTNGSRNRNNCNAACQIERAKQAAEYQAFFERLPVRAQTIIEGQDASLSKKHAENYDLKNRNSDLQFQIEEWERWQTVMWAILIVSSLLAGFAGFIIGSEARGGRR